MNAGFTVSLMVEIPEDLHAGIRKHLEERPDWDQDRFFETCVAHFLISNSSDKSVQRNAVRRFLDGMFKRSSQ